MSIIKGRSNLKEGIICRTRLGYTVISQGQDSITINKIYGKKQSKAKRLWPLKN